MKVAQILYSGLGGHGSVVFSLIGGDTDGRWENALGFLGVEPLLPEYRGRCDRLGIRHRYFQAREGRPWSQWRALASWLDAERPDAILNHSGTALIPCMLYAYKARVPHVFVEHTPIAVKRRSEWLFSRLAMRYSDAVVLLTSDYSGMLQERLGASYRPEKVSVIPNGINLRTFAPVPEGGARGLEAVVIGMAGRFSKAKRQDFLIDVLTELQCRSRLRWILRLAGEGDERPHNEEIASRRGLGAVHFDGLLQETELAEWFRSLNIYVHASEGETLSTSILQAMATALPVVASNVTGIRDLLMAEYGVLAQNGDVTGWAEALCMLADKPVLARQLGSRGRARVQELHSDLRMHIEYDRLLRREIGRLRGS